MTQNSPATQNNPASTTRPVAFALVLALVVILAPTVVAPSPAFAQSVDAQPAVPTVTPTFYYGFAGGVSNPHYGDLGPNLSAVLGKPAIFSTLRGQVEVSYSASVAHRSCWDECYSHTDRANVESLSVVASFFYDFRKDKALRPFIGGGLLYQVQSATSHWGTDHDQFSGQGGGFQWMAGLGYEIKPNWIVQASRRVVRGVDRQEQFQLGLRIGR